MKNPTYPLILALGVSSVAFAGTERLLIPNASFETIYVENIETGEFNIPYVNPNGQGLTGFHLDGFGLTQWGNGETSFVPGWTGTDTSYDASVMNESGKTSGYDTSFMGVNALAVNPPGFCQAELRETVEAGVYTLGFSSGWSDELADWTSWPSVDVTLQYSTDGSTWVELSEAAAMEAKIPTVALGEWRDDFYMVYTVAEGSAAIGAMMRVYITTTEANDGPFVDQISLTLTTGDTGGETWHGYPVDAEGWVNTGDWMGWVNVSFDPWIIVVNLGGSYAYIPDDSGWVYVPN